MINSSFSYTNDNTGSPVNYGDYTWPSYPQTKQVKRTTKTIEKYNAQGNLISREITVVEEDIIDVISADITTGTITDIGISSNSTIWDMNDPKNLWSYTIDSNTVTSASGKIDHFAGTPSYVNS